MRFSALKIRLPARVWTKSPHRIRIKPSTRDHRKENQNEPSKKSIYSDDGLIPQASLVGLPTELLLHIISFLRPSDLASLSLCNRLLHSTLNEIAVKLLECRKVGLDHEYEDLLINLSRDLPGIFYCYTCHELQKVARLETPRTGCKLDGLNCTKHYDPQNRPGWSSGTNYNFIYSHLQLIMSRHRLGPVHGIPLSELALTNITKWYRTPHFQDNHAFNAEGRIVSDALCLRLQDILVFPYEATRRLDWDLGVRICAHVDLPRYHSAHSILWCQMRRMRVPASRGEGCERCDALMRCSKCRTEFEVQCRAMEGGLVALIITKWIPLGQGQNPHDRDWRRHLPSRDYCNYTGDIVDVDCPDRSTRDAYEISPVHPSGL